LLAIIAPVEINAAGGPNSIVAHEVPTLCIYIPS
jgi:hypothetical protein